MSGRKNRAVIAGVGHSMLGRRLERPLGLLAKDAVTAAIADAGLDIGDIDGATTYARRPAGGQDAGRDGYDKVSLNWMVHDSGLLPNLRWWAETAVGNISTSIQEAAMAIELGLCNYALVWRALGMPSGSYSKSYGAEPAGGDLAFRLPYGLSGTAEFSLAYNRYLKLYGASREHLAAVAIAQRNGANKNPYAFFRDVPMTRQDYLAARLVADPLGLYDCDIPVDGAAAIVLTRADRAVDLPNRPVFIAGMGQASYNPRTVSAVGADFFENARVTVCSIARGIWDSTRMRPEDMDAAMLYDGYAPDIYFWLEGLGFCAEGEAFEYVQEGRIEQGGELPINTFGGNLSEGRLHGIGHWIEGALQLQGRAGQRQIRGAERIVVATGLLGHGSGAVLALNDV